MRKIYVDAKEIINDHTREIVMISYGDMDFKVNYSCPIGCDTVDGKNYLTFLCRIGKKDVKVYCDDSGMSDKKYFTIK
jgi:CDGSH-type Zn-finger protein